MSTLCLVTDTRPRAGDLVEVVVAAVAGGVDMVQIRDSGAGHGALAEALGRVADALAGGQVLLGVRGQAATIRGTRADVLHLGTAGHPGAARAELGPHGLVGRSAHDAEELEQMAPTADYLFVGPVWRGPEAEDGRGLGLVRRAATGEPGGGAAPTVPVAVPWFAAGGITGRNVDLVLEAGARRVAVGRAITCAADPGDVARRIARAVGRVWGDDPLTRPVNPDWPVEPD